MTIEKIIEGISNIASGFGKHDHSASPSIVQSSIENDRGIDPGKQLVLDKSTTDFMWVNSDSMIGAGIQSGDMIIIDRSLKAASGKIVIALLNGEMLIRRFERIFNKIRLVPETDQLAAIDVDGNYEGFAICGVVTHVIRPL